LFCRVFSSSHSRSPKAFYCHTIAGHVPDYGDRPVTAVVELDSVDTVYEGEQIPAIRDVTLKIASEEFVCIVGPNGAGKTTLLETINGLLIATRGVVRVLGHRVDRKGPWLRAKIGYTPQNFSVDPDTPFLVKQVLVMGRYGRVGMFRGLTSGDMSSVERAIEMMGIEDLLDRPVGKLSGGQLQKVLLARAIAKEPDLLLLDECFNSLDPQSKAKVLDILQTLNHELGLPIIVVTHGYFAVLDVCDRVIGLRDGRIVADISHPTDKEKEVLRQGNLIP